MSTSPKTLRTRNMTAAKKVLTLIRDAADTHLRVLDEGRVPESSFTAPLAKYEAALTTLRTLDALGEAGSADADAVEALARKDLGVLVRLVHQLTGLDVMEGDGSLSRVARVAFPDGAFADDRKQEA